MKEYCEVVITGAGAAGLLCGSLLAQQGAEVTILEKNNRVGRKLSATGNGRCNFTNLHMDENCYYGESSWIRNILDRVGPQDVIQQFCSYGVWSRQKDGYVYPHTNQAATVVDALYHACREQGAEIVTECQVKHIRRTDKGEFRIQTTSGTIRCRYLVLAAGGKAGKESGGDGSGYLLARSLGHTTSPIYPGLTGLVCEGRFWPRVAGTRVQGRFSLLLDGRRIPGEEGEVQIVKNGVSGIPVFQLCRVAAEALAQGRQVQGELDFVPSMEREAAADWISRHGLAGLLPHKWLPIAQKAERPDEFVKGFVFPVQDTFGMDRAQVTAGGVRVSEVSNETMESLLQENLFLLGELLDVDGICGGYNLHLAWSTAILAAREIAGRIV